MRQPGSSPVIVESGTSALFPMTVVGRGGRPDGPAANDNRRPLIATVRSSLKHLWRVLPPLVGVFVVLYAMSQ